MKLTDSGAGLRRRALTAASLGVAAFGLFLAEVLMPEGVVSGMRSAISSAQEAGIQTAVDSMFVRYSIDRSKVRSWRVSTVDRRMARQEQRVPVSREFPSLVFNYELKRMMENVGASVVATERSTDNSVTMHIVCNRLTVRSITFTLELPRD
jgi:hypothetical protein